MKNIFFRKYKKKCFWNLELVLLIDRVGSETIKLRRSTLLWRHYFSAVKVTALSNVTNVKVLPCFKNSEMSTKIFGKQRNMEIAKLYQFLQNAVKWIALTTRNLSRFPKKPNFLYYLIYIDKKIKWSTSIYDLVLINVCHFHLSVAQIMALSRYSCLYLGSCIHEFFNWFWI